MKLEIKEHSKDPDIVEVESYDAAETLKMMTEKNELGNRVHEFIVFGNNIYSTVSIQSVKVIG